MQSLLNFSLSLKIILFICAVMSSYECINPRELVLPHSPCGLTCTVHLKNLRKNQLVSRDIFENVLISNRHSAVFTLRSNKSLLIAPTIHYFEQCSVNIIIEEIKQLNSATTTEEFPAEKNFAGRGPQHSIYILIKWGCGRTTTTVNWRQYDSIALQMELSLFVHFVDICENEGNVSWHFPSYSLIPASLNDGSGKGMFLQLDRSQSIFIKPSLPLNNPSYTIDCVTATGRFTDGLSCFKNARLKHCNSYRQFLLGHLEGLLNFTCSYNSVYSYITKGTRQSPFGGILLDILADNTRTEFANFKLPEETTNLRISYCDFTHLENRLEFEVWVSPMEYNTWVALVLCTVLCALVCSVTLNHEHDGSGFLFKASGFATSNFDLISLLLRQYSSTIQRSILLTSFSLATFTISSMYESEITVGLVAPRKPPIIKDLAELVLIRKYRVWVRARMEAHKVFELEYLNQHMRMIKGTRLLTYKDTEFFAAPNYLLYTKQGLGNGSKKMAFFERPSLETEPDTLSFIRNENPTLHCHYVKRPVGNEWVVAMFSNVIGLKQIKLYKCFFNSGIVRFWKSLALTNLMNLVRKLQQGMAPSKANDAYINLENLTFIVIACCFLLATAFFLFLLETMAFVDFERKLSWLIQLMTSSKVKTFSLTQP
jgi:hypothetical protein